MEQSLIDLLHRSTVKLTVGREQGTGFFVAPGLILTCAHVVKEAGTTPIQVRWQHRHDFAEATIERFLPDIDIALLRFNPPPNTNVPCVLLDAVVESRDPLYLFGYPDQDFPNGCPATFNCEGLTGDEPPLIKFQLGQVRPGMSGSPLLNQRTGKVCGVVKFTRDRSLDLGGGAVPVSTVLSQCRELVELQQQFHQNDRGWKDRIRQAQKQSHGKRRTGDRTHRNRVAMLEKVRKMWITDVLDRSIYQETLIPLGLAERPHAVERPMDLLVQRSDQEDQLLPPGARLVDVYDTVDYALLILGAPGAGKTTQLLELTRNLLDRAVENEEHPIPVVFPLSTWAEQQRPLEAWLVDELSKRYHVSREIGQAWVQDDQVLPLLDGLDEVREQHRAACVEAINLFRQHHGLLPLVVCSRSTDYEAVERRLLLQSAVVVQPLTPQQVDAYLQQGGHKLAALRQALQNDSTLWELLDTPLMLQILILTYLDLPNIALPMLNTIEERRRYIFDKYIDRMFKRRSATLYFPNYQQNIHWLTWLAQQMTIHGQTVFYMEHLQPNWLPRVQRWIPKQGISMALWSLLTISIMPMVLTVEHNGINILTTFTGTMLLLASSVLLGLLIYKEDIKSVEKIYWSWKHLKWSALHMRDFFVLSCIICIFICELFLILLSGMTRYIFFPFTNTALVPFLIVKGLSFMEIEEKLTPNQGIHKSAKNSLFFGVLVFIILVIFKSCINTLLGTVLGDYLAQIIGYFFIEENNIFSIDTVEYLLTSWSLFDLIVIMFFVLIFGGYTFIQHILLRLLLIFNKSIPWRYLFFLDYACDRIFLRKVGGGYMFVHRFLMEHFASLNPALSPTEIQPLSVLGENPKFTKMIMFLCFLGIAIFCQSLFLPAGLRIVPESYKVFITILIISIVLLFVKRKKVIWVILLSLLYVLCEMYYSATDYFHNPVQIIYYFNIGFLILTFVNCKELYFIRFISILLILVNLISVESVNNILFFIILLMIALSNYQNSRPAKGIQT
jgi:hypothetical protein